MLGMPIIRVKQLYIDILDTLAIATMETSNELKERVRASYSGFAYDTSGDKDARNAYLIKASIL